MVVDALMDISFRFDNWRKKRDHTIRMNHLCTFFSFLRRRECRRRHGTGRSRTDFWNRLEIGRLYGHTAVAVRCLTGWLSPVFNEVHIQDAGGGTRSDVVRGREKISNLKKCRHTLTHTRESKGGGSGGGLLLLLQTMLPLTDVAAVARRLGTSRWLEAPIGEQTSKDSTLSF